MEPVDNAYEFKIIWQYVNIIIRIIINQDLF